MKYLIDVLVMRTMYCVLLYIMTKFCSAALPRSYFIIVLYALAIAWSLSTCSVVPSMMILSPGSSISREPGFIL